LAWREKVDVNQLNIMTQIISIIQKEQSEQTMMSLEIAELTGKQHKDVLKAIRNMEPAWENVCGRKFALTSRTVIQPNGGTREVPCYQLTKTECLRPAGHVGRLAAEQGVTALYVRTRLATRWRAGRVF